MRKAACASQSSFCASRPDSRSRPPVPLVKPGKKKVLRKPLACTDGKAWQDSTQASALRYSRLIHTLSCRTMRSMNGAGGSQAKASITTSMGRSEEHTSELQSLMRISYAVFCLKKKKNIHTHIIH